MLLQPYGWVVITAPNSLLMNPTPDTELSARGLDTDGGGEISASENQLETTSLRRLIAPVSFLSKLLQQSNCFIYLPTLF